jgi:transcriptional pleiotropic regulator of transition state genes
MDIKHKRLTSKAGLTIPKDIRLAAGFTGGMAVDIEEAADGIVIRKHQPTCCYCGSIDNVRSIKGRDTCHKCAEEIVEEVKSAYGNV